MKMNIGFELEAGVRDDSEARKTARSIKWQTGSDGSINIRKCNSYPIEFKSKVYIMPKNLNQMIADFKIISNEVNDINSSMGLHVHVSFSDKITYCRLCSYKFVRKFQTSYRKRFTKAKEQRRMGNSYCRFYPSKKQFEEEILKQIEFQDGKYRSINFGAISGHGTIEFRIFPATKSVVEFKRYVNFVRRMILTFIKKNNKDKIEPQIKDAIKKCRIRRRR